MPWVESEGDGKHGGRKEGMGGRQNTWVVGAVWGVGWFPAVIETKSYVTLLAAQSKPYIESKGFKLQSWPPLLLTCMICIQAQTSQRLRVCPIRSGKYPTHGIFLHFKKTKVIVFPALWFVHLSDFQFPSFHGCQSPVSHEQVWSRNNVKIKVTRQT